MKLSNFRCDYFQCKIYINVQYKHNDDLDLNNSLIKKIKLNHYDFCKVAQCCNNTESNELFYLM